MNLFQRIVSVYEFISQNSFSLYEYISEKSFSLYFREEFPSI